MAKGVKQIEDLDSSPRSTKYTKTMEELTAALAAAKEQHIAHEKEQEAREQKKSERVRRARERTKREKEGGSCEMHKKRAKDSRRSGKHYRRDQHKEMRQQLCKLSRY